MTPSASPQQVQEATVCNAENEATPTAAAGTSKAQDAGKTAHLDPNRRRTEGHVIHCDTRIALVSADVDENIDYMENYWSVGQMISIWVGKNRVIGQSAKVNCDIDTWKPGERNRVIIEVELIGEVVQSDTGTRFTTGISGFPQMGCVAHRIRSTDLAVMFENTAATTFRIGHITQDPTIDAKIDYEKLLSRHFAVVGSTGVGKSTSVTLMLRKIIQSRPDIRVLLLDPHNEFSTSFPKEGHVLNADRLVLPFWLFTLEEIAEVIFRGQEGVEREKELLRDLIVEAKTRLDEEQRQASSSLIKNQKKASRRITADQPLPYRIPDLIDVIDERIGKLETKAEKPYLKFLRDRITTITNDARFQFMFDPTKCGGDRINAIISDIFRVPQDGKPISIIEMSGLPSEVVASVVSVLCRMSFDLALASKGALQTLVVCEEAHRYVPADKDAGFWPTRLAIGRIAKEGRKYGVFLGIITQRPSELDPTILSQCNTFFAMRLANKRDQQIIAGAFNSGAQSTIAFLPSIANRECIAFGEALYTPMRMTFETVKAEDLPGASIRENQEAVRSGKVINLDSVIANMRRENDSVQAEDEKFFGNLANDDAGDLPKQPKVAPANPSGSALRGNQSSTAAEGTSTGTDPAQAKANPNADPFAELSKRSLSQRYGDEESRRVTATSQPPAKPSGSNGTSDLLSRFRKR